jgi:DNA-binding NarL/FixJ family response regulator
LVAAENPILRVGLETILEDAEDCRPVGSVSTVQEVRDEVARLRPDVVLLDTALRREDESLVPELAQEYPRTRTLMLVDHSEEECALRYFLSGSGKARLSGEALEILDDCCLVSLRASAWGCVPSSAEPERILKAIRAVTSGEIAAAPWLAAVLNQESGRSRRPRPAGDQPVTARELEVISLVAEGLSNKEVASRLGIREQTVKNHLVQISKKLGVSSRLEIGLEAVRHHVAVRRRSEPDDA